MSDTKMVKSAGEHWVCFVLSRRGWGAALTRDGLERTDILAVQADDSDRRMVEIQVKASSGSADRTKWPIGEKVQQYSLSDREWFALVLLGDSQTLSPRTFIVPRIHLAAATWIQHMNWQTDPTVRVGQRNTAISYARVRVETVKRYEDRWDLLEAPTTLAPVLLPPEFRSMATTKRIGLPPDHPWNSALPEW